MHGWSAAQILGLSVLAALVTTLGNLLATWLKEYLFVRSFERWKERRDLVRVYRKYRDPLLLAARELKSRLDDIEGNYPTNYLSSAVLDSTSVPEQLLANSSEDPYFVRYRLVSTAYRFCALLGWLELYRQELTFLDTGEKTTTRELDEMLAAVRSDIADGQLNKATDLRAWNDRLIFREDQRAIGEAMITDSGVRVVTGYGAFRQRFEDSRSDKSAWWLRVALAFLVDLQPDHDFRRERFKRMASDLSGAIAILER
jgi:hypothetical protein